MTTPLIDRLAEALRAASVTSAHYRAKSSGMYVGGMEHLSLYRCIVELLAEYDAAQSPRSVDTDVVRGGESFQARVGAWMGVCFGEAISRDRIERKLAITDDDGVSAGSETVSCLCCGRIGLQKVWHADHTSIYVCETCWTRATVQQPVAATDASEWMVTRADLDKAVTAYNDQSMQIADAQYVCMGRAFESIGLTVDWSSAPDGDEGKGT